MKAFVAFNMRQKDTDRIFGLVEEALASLPSQAINSVKYHRQTFHDSGGWDPWISEIVQGIDYFTRQPHFDFMVCTEQAIGRATAQLVQGFLDNKKPVLYFAENEGFSEVSSLVQIEEDNWQSGWNIIVDK